MWDGDFVRLVHGQQKHLDNLTLCISSRNAPSREHTHTHSMPSTRLDLMASSKAFNVRSYWQGIFVSTLSKSLLASTAQCFFPNAQPSWTDEPCSDDTGAYCPKSISTWLSSGVCQYRYNGVITFGRHSCADRSWTDPRCPKFCTDGQHILFSLSCVQRADT